MLDFRDENAFKEPVLSVAKLMAISAKTAPKGKGIGNVQVVVLNERGELEGLADKMDELAEEYGEFFGRDADNIRNSIAVVLIGCNKVEFKLKKPKKWPGDPDLIMSVINLGIAIGSAVKTASIHNVDNRVMYSAAIAAQELGFIDSEVVMAIPLSAKDKSIYFDRRWKK